MSTDTMYDLAIRELSDLTDPAKEMLDEAARLIPAALAAADDDEAAEEPPLSGDSGRG